MRTYMQTRVEADPTDHPPGQEQIAVSIPAAPPYPPPPDQIPTPPSSPTHFSSREKIVLCAPFAPVSGGRLQPFCCARACHFTKVLSDMSFTGEE